jgi:hypothetical protein
MDGGYARWAGVFAPVVAEIQEPPPRQQRGVQGNGIEVHAKDTALRADDANGPATAPSAAAPHPLLQSCMCRLAPQASCMVCARWQRHAATVLARAKAQRN